mmetsp:Transcript_22046/g.32859  ORF Transcript_22046/g.32859 Transcript_22046/m.32859 type:complete len:232 (-) Transcript_22046:844-1539(-)
MLTNNTLHTYITNRTERQRRCMHPTISDHSFKNICFFIGTRPAEGRNKIQGSPLQSSFAVSVSDSFKARNLVPLAYAVAELVSATSTSSPASLALRARNRAPRSLRLEVSIVGVALENGAGAIGSVLSVLEGGLNGDGGASSTTIGADINSFSSSTLGSFEITALVTTVDPTLYKLLTVQYKRRAEGTLSEKYPIRSGRKFVNALVVAAAPSSPAGVGGASSFCESELPMT